jgi:hypothetical protein
MDESVRNRLAQDWDAHENDHPILERAYCLRWRYEYWGGELVYRVISATPATILAATTHSVTLECAPGNDVAELHTHPPQTCAIIGSVCWKGGELAYQCMPSDADIAWMQREKQPFGAIQCDRNAVIFYVDPATVTPPRYR